MKYLLIDSNNLSLRVSFTNNTLVNKDLVPSGLHYGYFQSLINLKKKFPDYQFLISWDGHSERRIKESEEAVRLGITPEIYKGNRKKEVMPQPILDFYEQSPYLKRALEHTGIPQIRIDSIETDDLLSAYAKLLKKDNEVVCITSDKDYYQILDDSVTVYDGMKDKMITKTSFTEEYGIEPTQWVDVGALMGDDGDNIFGTPGVGEKTALKEIKKHETWEKVISFYKEKHKGLLTKYPDYGSQASIEEITEFKEKVIEAKSEKDKLIFPEVNMMMPYARVILAFAKGEIKIPKVELMLMAFEKRTKVAYSLKKMDDIPDLPEIKQGEFNADKLMEYFEYYDIETLKDGISAFEK